MKVLLVGNGAREHAMAKALARSDRNVELISFMSRKNPGIAALSSKTIINDLKTFPSLDEIDADLAFIGPEDPLAYGIVDYLEEKGMPAVGPGKSNARLEASKVFCRELISKHRIPINPGYRVCRSREEIESATKSIPKFVVKPDGLTGGKGVRVMGDHFDSIEAGNEYARLLLEKDGQVIIEELLKGTEFTLQAYVSKNGSMSFMPLVKDYKRAYNGDTGPNTGSMGSYSSKDHSLPYLSDQTIEKAKKAMQKTIEALKKETCEPYCGILYGQFILADNRISLIEYNVRFGDPEAINVLSLLTDDFVEMGEAMVCGKALKKISHNTQATACIYIVPVGYPDNPVKDKTITVPQNITSEIYFASVYGEPNSNIVYTTGSRAIALLSKSDTVREAHDLAMEDVKKFTGPVFYRTDIGLA